MKNQGKFCSLMLAAALVVGAGCASPGKKTAIGAGAGAGTGAIIGGATGGWKGAAIGGAIGGMVGGAAGNMLDKRQKELEQVAETKKTADGRLLVNLKNDLLFDTGKADLKPEGVQQVSQLADILVKYPNDKLRIEGHTDNVGAADYNEDLSRRRAATVQNILTQRGVNLSQVTTVGMGESAPVAPNNTADGRRRNRRVMLNIDIPEVRQAMEKQQSEQKTQQGGQVPADQQSSPAK